MKRSKKREGSSLIILLMLMLIIKSCGEDELINVVKTSTNLNGIKVSTWMYQIQWLDEHVTIDELDTTQYDMLVVEPG